MPSERSVPLLPRTRKQFRAWQIDITTKCLLGCRMCIRRGVQGWKSADMPFADFARLVPLFDDVEAVVLQGWGEPLCHPDLVRIVAAAKGRGLPHGIRHPDAFRPPAVGFVTSGRGLDRVNAEGLMDAGLDFIGFSFAGSTAATHETIRAGSDFEALAAAVRAVADLKRSRGVVLPRMHIVYLLLRNNLADLQDLPRLARDLGAEGIVLTNLVHVTDAWQEEQKVFSCSGDAPGRSAVEAALDAAHALGVPLRPPSLLPREVVGCEEDPLGTVYISPDGAVSPCVYLHPPAGDPFTRIFCGRAEEAHLLSFGNVLERPFREIWDQEGYADFRRKWAQRAKGRGPLASLLHALGAHRAALSDPPAPCRTCHKSLGL